MSGAVHSIVIPQVAIPAEEAITVVVPPDGMNREEMNALVACLISVFKTDPPSYLAAVELVYNIMQLSLAGLRLQIADIRAIQVNTVNPTRAELLAWVGLDNGVGAQTGARLPNLFGPVVEEARAVTDTVPVYAAVASILMAVGKQASESQAVATLDKRPDALVRRFTITEADRILLPGRAAGPSRSSLEYMYNAFSVYTELRGEITRFLIGVKRSSAHYPMSWEVIMTNFHLMRGAGMTHVDAILKLAKMHPWTLKVPQLEPYWDRFASDLQEFERVDPDVRPYHRLLVPQTSFLFLSPNLAPLVAVAGHFVKEVEKTFANYVYRAADYAELIGLVERYAPSYIPTHQTNTLAALLGVADVPLPKIQGKKKEEDQEETVV